MGVNASKQAAVNLKNCTLWKADRSPACRAVMMALDAMNLSINEVDVNMDKGEHKSSDLISMNCLQTLPILKDKDLILCDSHAINTYLASRYYSTGHLLPKDPGGRAAVDQMLHYDNGVLYPKYRAATYPILHDNCPFVMPQNITEIENAYSELEGMLAKRNWLCGVKPTLADISIAATVSTLHIIVPIDETRCPCLSCWLKRISEEMFYLTANKKGLCEFARRIDSGRVCDEREFKCPRTSLRRRSVTTVEGDKLFREDTKK